MAPLLKAGERRSPGVLSLAARIYEYRGMGSTWTDFILIIDAVTRALVGMDRFCGFDKSRLPRPSGRESN